MPTSPACSTGGTTDASGRILNYPTTRPSATKGWSTWAPGTLRPFIRSTFRSLNNANSSMAIGSPATKGVSHYSTLPEDTGQRLHGIWQEVVSEPCKVRCLYGTHTRLGLLHSVAWKPHLQLSRRSPAACPPRNSRYTVCAI